MHPATSKELQTSIDNYAAELNSANGLLKLVARLPSPEIFRELSCVITNVLLKLE